MTTAPPFANRDSLFYRSLRQALREIERSIQDDDMLTADGLERVLANLGYNIPIWNNDDDFVRQFEWANPGRFSESPFLTMLREQGDRRREEDEWIMKNIRKRKNHVRVK